MACGPWPTGFPVPSPPTTKYPQFAAAYLPVMTWYKDPANPSDGTAKTTWGDQDVIDGQLYSNKGVHWPRLTQFQDKAILADVTGHAAALMSRHKDGVNALFGSGSAAWIPLSAFQKDLVGTTGQPSTSLTDPSTGFFPHCNDSMLNDAVTPNTGFWPDLDAYSH